MYLLLLLLLATRMQGVIIIGVRATYQLLLLPDP